MTSIILNGNPYSDTGASTGRDLVGDDRRGHTRWLLPMLADAVADLGAKQSACASAVSAALAHVATAQDWAIKTSGPVSGSEYSAKYHAQAAATSASTAGGHANAAASSAAQAAMNSVLQKYLFSTTTTMADPGAGNVRLNSATLSAVTAIALDEQTADTGNPNIRNWLLTFDDSTSPTKGQLILREIGSPTNFAIYNLTSLTAQTGWVQFNVTHVASGGSFANSDALVLDFVRAGDAGSVSNVNGKTGSVITLTAADVGAEPAMADATTAEMQAGTVTALRAMSPKNIADAIAALGQGIGAGSETATGSVTLTAGSASFWRLSPTAVGQAITLPWATDLKPGAGLYTFVNTVPEIPVAIKNSTGTIVGWVVSDSPTVVSLLSNSSAAGVWHCRNDDPASAGGVYLYGALLEASNNQYCWKLISRQLPDFTALAVAQTNVSLRNLHWPAGAFARTDLIGNSTGSSGGGDCSVMSNQYHSCAIGTDRLFLVWLDPVSTAIKCLVAKVSSSGAVSTDSAVITGEGALSGIIRPYCVPIGTDRVLVTWVVPNSSLCKAVIVTLNSDGSAGCSWQGGSVITFATGGAASQSFGGQVAKLSDSLVHVVTANSVVALSVSGTVITKLGETALPASADSPAGIARLSGTQSVVVHRITGGAIAGWGMTLVTNTGAAPTVGVPSGMFAAQGGILALSEIEATGRVLLIRTHGTIQISAPIQAFIIALSGGVPVVQGALSLPEGSGGFEQHIQVLNDTGVYWRRVAGASTISPAQGLIGRRFMISEV